MTALAERLSDDLLEQELLAFGEIELLFFGRVGDAVRIIEDAVAEGAGSLVVPPIQALGVLVGEICRASGPVLAGLLEQSIALTVASTEQELTACEQTLAKRYEGSAMHGLRWIKENLTDGQNQAGSDYARMMGETVSRFVMDVEQQMGYWSLFAEPAQALIDRITKYEPVNLTGCGGRGVLWRAQSSLQRAQRAVTIDMVNWLREGGIEAMNGALASG